MSSFWSHSSSVDNDNNKGLRIRIITKIVMVVLPNCIFLVLPSLLFVEFTAISKCRQRYSTCRLHRVHFSKIINENKLCACCKCALRVNKIKMSSDQVASFIDKVKSVGKIAAVYFKQGWCHISTLCALIREFMNDMHYYMGPSRACCCSKPFPTVAKVSPQRVMSHFATWTFDSVFFLYADTVIPSYNSQ